MNYIPFGKWTVRAVARSALPSRQRMHRDLKNRWTGLQAVIRRPVTQRLHALRTLYTTPAAGTVLDQISLCQGLPVTTTVVVRTVQGFSIHVLAPSCHSVFARGGTINRKCAISITAVEGHYQNPGD
jgi:hypothetical protein